MKKEELILKLYNKKCSYEELQQLFDILEKEEELEGAVMETLWEQLNEYPKLNKEASQEIFDSILSKKKVVQLPSNKWRFLKIASSIAILFTLAATIFLQLPAVAPEVITMTTISAEQKSFELPDGSKVFLNANSALSFKKNWSDNVERQVWLKGEAFFEVAKKPQTNQKFQVITKDLVVEVLGTIFNINSHQEATKVFLEEGKIKLNLKKLKKAVWMKPGNFVAFSDKHKQLPQIQNTTAELHTSWKTGIILFKNSSLEEILLKMKEIYGVTITVSAGVDYTKKLNTGIPIDKFDTAINILKKTIRLDIIKRDNQFIIQK